MEDTALQQTIEAISNLFGSREEALASLHRVRNLCPSLSWEVTMQAIEVNWGHEEETTEENEEETTEENEEETKESGKEKHDHYAKMKLEEEAAAAIEEEKRRKEEEAANLAAKQQKRAKEKEKKLLRKERSRLRTLSAPVLSQPLLGISVEYVEDLCRSLDTEQLRELCEKMENKEGMALAKVLKEGMALAKVLKNGNSSETSPVTAIEENEEETTEENEEETKESEKEKHDHDAKMKLEEEAAAAIEEEKRRKEEEAANLAAEQQKRAKENEKKLLRKERSRLRTLSAPVLSQPLLGISVEYVEDLCMSLDTEQLRELCEKMENKEGMALAKVLKEGMALAKVLKNGNSSETSPVTAIEENEEETKESEKEKHDHYAKMKLEEEAAAAIEEEKRRKEEEAANLAAKQQKRAKEKEKKLLRKERSRLRTLSAPVLSQPLLGISVEYVEDLCRSLDTEQLRELCEKMENKEGMALAKVLKEGMALAKVLKNGNSSETSPVTAIEENEEETTEENEEETKESEKEKHDHDAKMKLEEEAAAAIEEEKRRKEEEAANLAAEQQKRAKENEKKLLRKERSRLRTLSAPVLSQPLLGISVEYVDDLCMSLDTEQLRELCEKMENKEGMALAKVLKNGNSSEKSPVTAIEENEEETTEENEEETKESGKEKHDHFAKMKLEEEAAAAIEEEAEKRQKEMFSLSQIEEKLQEMSTTSNKNFETVRKDINDLRGLLLANFETVMNAINDLRGLPVAAQLSTEEETPVPWPNGVKYQFQTLPVHDSDVVDGDGLNVYVRATDVVPEISKCNQVMINRENANVLAYKVRIRLRGIDAPELGMEFGKESQEGLCDMVEGNVLTVLAYADDQYGRCLADLHCHGIFVQEEMLKKGLAWHYSAFDTRANFRKWEKEAKQKKMGLWASPNPPVKPWEWRRNNRAQSQSQS